MCDYRKSRENWEWVNLAPYASHSSDPSLNWRRSENDAYVADFRLPRRRPEDVHFPNTEVDEIQTEDLAGSLSRFKTAFQVDKERISSSTAFRRLEYKTQMFVSHEGDHFRTRLTHTIEVNETARFIAQALRLNEDLVEAVALGHDLGHTPFGHSGETALDTLFQKHWPLEKPPLVVNGERYGAAFYHNVQGVRVVDMLEKGYEWDRRPPAKHTSPENPPARRGRGIDLTWAVREGILKHSSRGLRAGDVRMYSSDYLMAELEPFQPATLEGQVVEFADEIASIMHDLEDGLRSRLFTRNNLRQALLGQITAESLPDLLGLTPRFGHVESPLKRSRVIKLQKLLELIRTDNDCTIGVLLAFLRTLLLSNLIETSFWKIFCALVGNNPVRSDVLPRIQSTKANDLIWIQVKVGSNPGPTKESYCMDAWNVDPTRRGVCMQTFGREQAKVKLVSKLAADNARIWWVMKSPDPDQSREIIVENGDGVAQTYPLGNVCVTFTGAKLVGYDENLLSLREFLRRKFIPEHLHNASVVRRMNNKGERFLGDIFKLYLHSPSIMHRSALERYDLWEGATSKDSGKLAQNEVFLLRIVEHLQGMTDRYLTEEYARLFMPGTSVSERDEMAIVDGGKPPFRDPDNNNNRGAKHGT